MLCLQDVALAHKYNPQYMQQGLNIFISSYFDTGGALDSQTSDSQYVEGLYSIAAGHSSHTESDLPGFASVGVQTDTHTHCCRCYQDNAEALALGRISCTWHYFYELNFAYLC